MQANATSSRDSMFFFLVLIQFDDFQYATSSRLLENYSAVELGHSPMILTLLSLNLFAQPNLILNFHIHFYYMTLFLSFRYRS